MKEKDALSRAFAMPLTSPAFQIGPYASSIENSSSLPTAPSGQVVRVSFEGRKGGYSHSMFLDDHPPIAVGRELWGFPKKLANPILRAEIDTLVGELHYGQIRVAVGTMGYKHKQADLAAIGASLAAPNNLLKIIPTSTGHRAFANWSNIT